MVFFCVKKCDSIMIKNNFKQILKRKYCLRIIYHKNLRQNVTTKLYREYLEDIRGITMKQKLPGSQKSADFPYQALKRSF